MFVVMDAQRMMRYQMRRRERFTIDMEKKD